MRHTIDAPSQGQIRLAGAADVMESDVGLKIIGRYGMMLFGELDGEGAEIFVTNLKHLLVYAGDMWRGMRHGFGILETEEGRYAGMMMFGRPNG